MYTQLFLKWTTSEELLNSPGNCSMLWGSLEGRRVWRRMDACICMVETIHLCSLDIITTLLSVMCMHAKLLQLSPTL